MFGDSMGVVDGDVGMVLVVDNWSSMDDAWRKVALDVVDNGDDGRAVLVVVVQAMVDEHCDRKKTDNCHGRTRHYLRSC